MLRGSDGTEIVVVGTVDDACGVVPDELGAELFPGGGTEGNLCFQVGENEGGFVLTHEPLWSLSSERRYLRLE